IRVWYTFPCREVRPDSTGAFCFLGPPARPNKSFFLDGVAQAKACGTRCFATFRERAHSYAQKQSTTPSTPGASRTGCAAKGAEMPSYQNVTPPISLSSGDVGFSFNNEAFPGSATSGSQFAVPSFTGVPDAGTAVRWQTIFGTNPTAVNIVLQGAMSDVDAEYQTIDTTTATAGEARTAAAVQAKFLRIRFVSSTGGAGLTAKLMV